MAVLLSVFYISRIRGGWMLLVAILLSVFYISGRDVSLVDTTSGCLIIVSLLYFQKGRIPVGCY